MQFIILYNNKRKMPVSISAFLGCFQRGVIISSASPFSVLSSVLLLWQA